MFKISVLACVTHNKGKQGFMKLLPHSVILV